MAKKQYYCIDFRNMHTGIHGLFVFDNRQKAEDNYTYLKRGIHELEILRTKEKISEQEGNNKYHELVNEVYIASSDFIEEVSSEKDEKMIRNRLEQYYDMHGFRFIVVNFMQTLDLYI